jgi:tRNA-Thr(GGU) m(6)t(6)A37 methyltransferase TsaA
MSDNFPHIGLEAIGIVKNEFAHPLKGGEWQTIVSDIVVKDSLSEALEDLEDFSHIIVLFWLHQISPQERRSLKVHPSGRQDIPPKGVFATRTARRPNPLGLSVARLLERRGNVLKVLGLDAINGTPVVDIKPSIPAYDTMADAKVPPWATWSKKV